MNNKNRAANALATGRTGDRPFPWICTSCRKRDVYRDTIRYEAEVNHDGKLYKLTVDGLPVARCRSCGETLFGNETDKRIDAELRRKLGLMSPTDIRENRRRLGLSQSQMSEQLAVAAETISRWENGVLVQSRAMDRYLRLFFRFPEVRACLSGECDWAARSPEPNRRKHG